MENGSGLQLTPLESGFINSQPSIVEFIASLPLLDDVDVLAGSNLANSVVSTDEEINMPPYYDPQCDLGPLSLIDSTAPNAAEFAWMKDKKPARKNQHRNLSHSSLFFFLVLFYFRYKPRRCIPTA